MSVNGLEEGRKYGLFDGALCPSLLALWKLKNVLTTQF